MYDYIPDITERYPEGFDGVDLTDFFYQGGIDYSRQMAEEYEREVEENDKN